jgi:hypothetical protein
MSYWSDRVARPRSGYFFALSIGEIASHIESLGFEQSFGHRIRAWQLNDYREFEYGFPLSTFAPRSYLVIFSLPDNINRVAARAALAHTFRKFIEIEQKPEINLLTQQIAIYRAYLGPFERIMVTRDVINVRFPWGLPHQDAAKPGNVKSKKHKESVLCEDALTNPAGSSQIEHNIIGERVLKLPKG